MHILFTFRKRRGRKLVVTPDGAPWAPRPRVDDAMVKALARAFRRRRMLAIGVHATPENLVRAKGAAPSYLGPLLRLTLLAPVMSSRRSWMGGSRRSCNWTTFDGLGGQRNYVSIREPPVCQSRPKAAMLPRNVTPLARD